MPEQNQRLRSRISSFRKKAKLLKQCSDLVNEIQGTARDPNKLRRKRNGSKKRRMARSRRV